MHGIYIGQLINVPSTMVAGGKDDSEDVFQTYLTKPSRPHKKQL